MILLDELTGKLSDGRMIEEVLPYRIHIDELLKALEVTDGQVIGDWCVEHFGDSCGSRHEDGNRFDPLKDWDYTNSHACFKSEADAVLFKLRWVG